ncbi:MlaD family protein [Mycobacterium arosiense]|uniref:MlaD family protein n=1 Tax=Mycobacterium arosiense TaxID=425468 RepID=UPI001B7FFC8F|nr:MlaD family protein [Mycobacterium arosiense]
MRATALIVAAVLTVASCESINVNNLPQPGNSYSDGYDVTIEFSNTLNLPERAKVMMDGTPVGVVTKIESTAQEVDVTARIGRGVVVPSNIHAALQQATVLGDIYIALDRPETGASVPVLRPGGTIPISATTSPPQLEDTIASLANFVSSGSIQRMQNTIIGLNRVSPHNNEGVRKVASRVATDLGDLANNVDLVDKWLTDVSGTAQVMHDRGGYWDDMLSPEGLLGNYRTQIMATYLSTAIPSIGSIYRGGFWLVPLIESLANAMGAVQQSKWVIDDEVPRWQKLFTDYFLPQDKYPAMNITSIQGPDGRELLGSVQQVLSMLGATR